MRTSFALIAGVHQRTMLTIEKKKRAIMKPLSSLQTRATFGVLLSLVAGQLAGLGATSLVLQGQSQSSTNWITGTIQNWQELDYIPCRVYVTGGPVNNQTITISFPHLSGITPGFEDLTSFSTSPNTVINAGPVLAAPASGTWSYTFTINVTNSNPAYVQFAARLAAGAHMNTAPRSRSAAIRPRWAISKSKNPVRVPVRRTLRLPSPGHPPFRKAARSFIP
jgi:hypothetical protein